MPRSRIPSLIYGTAWKKDRTRSLVRQALTAGFRGIDTAAQPKHYREDLVAQGVADAMKEAHIKREDLYLQTKFTSTFGQDPERTPYDRNATISEQVDASVASSMGNFALTSTEHDQTYLNCLVLHSPYPSYAQTLEAWQAMERFVPHPVRTLGISNIYHPGALRALYEAATVKPRVVQNRFHRETHYDVEIRAFCAENGIVYQSFWTLTANPHLLKSVPVNELASQSGVSSAVALYGLVLSLGNVSVLDGTTNAARMVEDLQGVQRLQNWAEGNGNAWTQIQESFAALVDSSL